jgi:DNA (cytosine-5)-methyltransferase 1
MQMLDLFSGIGGFHKGFAEAGWEFDWIGFSEIDKHASSVYRYRYPEAVEIGDITVIRPERDLPDKLTVLCGGFPCQSFSIAGARGSFSDTRGTLFFEIARILSYYRDKGDPVPYFLLENVKGLYSAGDYTAFATIYGVLAELGYNVECSLENTKYYLPQNRERIYIAGYIGDRGSGQIFPLGESNSSDRDKSGKGVTVSCIDASYHKGVDGKRTMIADYRTDEGLRIRSDNVSPCLNSVKASETEPSWMPPLAIEKIGNIYESGSENGNVYSDKGISPTLKSGETSNPKHGGIGSSNSPKILIENSYGVKALDETLAKNDLKVDDVKALDLYNRKAQDISPTLTEPHHNSLRLYENSKIRRLTPNECERLQGFSTRNDDGTWDDGWTSTGMVDGEVVNLSDTQRYKMCGNAVTVPVVRAIAAKILMTKGCDHSETEYQPPEPENSAEEGLVCVLCGEDLDLQEADWDEEGKELRL